MLKEIKKMWLDTMINPATGRYGMKRLQSFCGGIIAFLFSLPFVIELHIHPQQSFNITTPPMELIYAWMAFAGIAASLTVLGKNNAIKDGSTADQSDNLE